MPPFGFVTRAVAVRMKAALCPVERARELEIAQHHLARLGIGDGDLERQRVSRAVELKREWLGFVGLRSRRASPRANTSLPPERGRSAPSGCTSSSGTDSTCTKPLKSAGCGGVSAKAGQRILPGLQLTLDDDDDGELGERFVAFFRTQNQRARAVRLLADAPVLKRLAGDLLDLALAGDRQRKLLRRRLAECLNVASRCCVSLSRLALIQCWSEVEKMSLSLSARLSAEHSLDGQSHLAVSDSAADRGVLDFRLSQRLV